MQGPRRGLTPRQRAVLAEFYRQNEGWCVLNQRWLLDCRLSPGGSRFGLAISERGLRGILKRLVALRALRQHAGGGGPYYSPPRTAPLDPLPGLAVSTVRAGRKGNEPRIVLLPRVVRMFQRTARPVGFLPPFPILLPPVGGSETGSTDRGLWAYSLAQRPKGSPEAVRLGSQRKGVWYLFPSHYRVEGKERRRRYPSHYRPALVRPTSS